MCKCLISTLGFIVSLLALYYLILVYRDTKIDVFQKPIEPGEKEKYFIDPALNPDQMLKYDQQCQAYQDIIMNPNTKKLGDVFNLNVEAVHNNSFYIIFINLFVIFFYAFIFIALIFLALASNSMACFAIIVVILSLAAFIIMIIGFIYFFVIIHNFYSGDTNAYISFLDCKNVNYSGFGKYRIVEEFKSDFKWFMIYYTFSMIFSFFTNKKDNNNNS